MKDIGIAPGVSVGPVPWEPPEETFFKSTVMPPMIKGKLRLAFDLDGTLNRYPKVLGIIMHELKNAGHYCIVLTAAPLGETVENREAMLREVGIMPGSYTGIVVVPEDGGVSKASYCQQNQIDLLIDDTQGNFDFVKRDSPMTCRLKIV